DVVGHRLAGALELQFGNGFPGDGLAIAPGGTAEVPDGPLQGQLALAEHPAAASEADDRGQRWADGRDVVEEGDIAILEIHLGQKGSEGDRLVASGTGDVGTSHLEPWVVFQSVGDGVGQAEDRHVAVGTDLLDGSGQFWRRYGGYRSFADLRRRVF